MAGRADKRIILTTGTFTLDAMKEATRDGVPPIGLVDQDKLVKLFDGTARLAPKADVRGGLGVLLEEFRK